MPRERVPSPGASNYESPRTDCQRLACWHKNIPGSSGAKMRSSSYSSNGSALDGKIPRCRVIQATESKERHLEFDSRSDVQPVQLFAHRITDMIGTLTLQDQTCSTPQHAVKSIKKIRRRTSQNSITIIQLGDDE